jgi:hypothetical protein
LGENILAAILQAESLQVKRIEDPWGAEALLMFSNSPAKKFRMEGVLMKNPSKMYSIALSACLILFVSFVLVTCFSDPGFADPILKKFPMGFTTDFRLDGCTFATTGSNEYFILEPGYQLNLAGEDDGELLELSITVLSDTELIGPVLTRVVEEREWVDGELVEVSRNFFAFCIETSSVFYFGEDVDIYEDGVIVSHEGEWRAFDNENEPGLMMPGIILLGSSFFQEIAPDIAMDRAVIVKMDAELEVPLDTYSDCVVIFETTPLEPFAKDWKFYAPGVGLIKDGPAELVSIVTP